jgi:hypothetical protein
MKKILTIIVGAMFLSGCSTLSQKQDAPAGQGQNKQAADASFEQRMKQARKPYNFINVSYMDVKDGMEEEYLKVESAWKKIHEKLASEGKIISWGLAKARKNEFGYEYITWVILRSRGALDNLYDMKALKAWMGEDKMDDLMAKTMETRSITGGELLTLEDYTLVSFDPPNEVVDSKNFSFHWNFMTPTEGKAQDYVNTEKNAFQPRHQKKSELNPRFQWWNLQKQILSWGSVNKAPYRTVDFFRNDVAQPSDKELEKINAQMPAFPEGLTYQNVMKMREMKRVTFDVVHLIDRSMSAETKAWETLIGTWTAPSATQWEKGAYRRKTITPYTEVFELFDAEGKVIDRQKKPLSIEVINGINYFTIYPPNNEASFPFKIVDGKWYENMRGMLSNNSEKPDQFLVYKKTDQPVFSDQSSFTKKGEDVELVKAIFENYAAGKIDEYLALFTKDAKVTHNNNEPITISELAKIHRAHHEQIAGPVKILSSNYEVIATANGNKYGHAWVKFENTYKNGVKAVTPVFVSFGINNKGKVYFEHGFYDTATVPDDSVYSEN